MTTNLIAVLQAVSATAAWICGLAFVRFWRRSGDPLFLWFGSAFWLMALCWILLALFSPTEEARPYIYSIRLVAFLLIIAGIVQKNRT